MWNQKGPKKTTVLATAVLIVTSGDNSNDFPPIYDPETVWNW
jgi:hypothetical protein